MKKEDEGIRPVWDVRKKISAEFETDPERLVEHYMAEQERYRSRLLRPLTGAHKDAVGEDSRRR